MNRGVAVFALVLGLSGGGLWWWYKQRQAAPWQPALRAREIAMRVLGEHLVQQDPHSKLLVVGNPFVLRPGQAEEIYSFEKASVRGLQEAVVAPATVQVVYPSLRPNFESAFVDPKTTTPLSYLVVEGAFDRLIETNKACSVLVSLIGLPVDVRETHLWRDAENVRLGLLFPDWRLLGDRGVVREAVASGKIVAAVVERPEAEVETLPGEKDYRSEFNRRFILVTRTNIDEELRTHPQLF